MRYISRTIELTHLKSLTQWVLVGMIFFLKPEWMVVSNSVMGKMRDVRLRGEAPGKFEMPMRRPRGDVMWEIRYSHLELETKYCE